MDPLESESRAISRGEDRWAAWKHLIRIKFLAEDKSLDQVLAELRELGFQATSSQLEYRLKKWCFLKNIKDSVWRYVDRVITDRSVNQGKETAVILSGRRLPPETVIRQTKRAQRPTMLSLQSLEVAHGNLPLYFCTPRSSSTELSRLSSWPVTLPWIQFCNSHLEGILNMIDFAPESTKENKQKIEGPIDPICLRQIARTGSINLPRSGRATLLPLIHQQMARASLEIVFESQDLLARMSLDHIAAQFDYVVPEAYVGENLQRSTTLLTGDLSELQRESLILLMYLASNNLVVSDVQGEGRSFNAKEYAEQAQLIISLCRLCGLTQPRVIRGLVNISRSSSTLTAVIDTLFRAAVEVQAADIIYYLLEADERINLDRGVGLAFWPLTSTDHSPVRVTPLYLAVIHGCIDLARVLLDAGANVNAVRVELSLIGAAILALPLSQSSKMVPFLLERHAPLDVPKGESCISALQAAVMAGSTEFIDLFIREGADPNYRWFPSQDTHIADILEVARADTCRFRLEGISCLGLAASFCIQSLQCTNKGEGQLCLDKDEDKAIGLCYKILNICGPRVTFSDESIGDAMTLASARGYEKVVRFLHLRSATVSNPHTDRPSAIYAAVAFDHIQTCQLLLELGASASPHSCDGIDFDIAPLQIAVHNGSSALAEILVQYGADINKTCNVLVDFKNDIHIPTPWWCHCTRNYLSYTCSGRWRKDSRKLEMSPLHLAILRNAPSIASLLLITGAVATGVDLFAAAERGHLQLVKQLIKRGIHPDKAVLNGVTAFCASSSHGHKEVSTCLLDAGATIHTEVAVWRTFSTTQLEAILSSQQLEFPQSLGRDVDGRTYLENAILSGDNGVIDFAFSLDKTMYDSGALCAAVSMGTRDLLPTSDHVLEELISRRSMCSCDYVDGTLENTAIAIAIWNRRPKLVPLLLRKIPHLVTDALAVIPMKVANISKRIHPEISLESVAPPGHGNILLTDDAIHWHSSSYPEVSPILFAVKRDDEEAINILLEAGYQPDGYTLRAAVADDWSPEIIIRLAQSCKDVEAECVLESWPMNMMWYNFTPLMAAAWNGNKAMVKYLLDLGSNINEVRPVGIYSFDDGETAISSALARQNASLVELLLDRGANPNISHWSEKVRRRSALADVVCTGPIGLVRRLLQYGADCNAVDIFGFSNKITPLETAAFSGRLDVIELLRDWGVLIEGRGCVQYVNAIRHATQRGFGAVAERLRSYREWTTEDELIWQRSEQFESYYWLRFRDPSAPRALRIYHEEHSSCELVDLIAAWKEDEINPAWCRPDDKKKWQRGVALEIQQWVNTVLASRYDVNRTDLLEAAITEVKKALENYDMKGSIGWFDHGDHIEPHAKELATHALRSWATAYISATSLVEGSMGLWEEHRSLEAEDNSCDTFLSKFSMGTTETMLNAPAHGGAESDFGVDTMPVLLEEGKGDDENILNWEDIEMEELSGRALKYHDEDCWMGSEDLLALYNSTSEERTETAEVDELRRTAVLKDLLGEEEAAFMPLDCGF